MQFGDIEDLVTDTVPGVSRDAVKRRFLFGAKIGWFGRHGPRQTIEQLVDLDASSFTPRGRYSLRPSYIRVEASPKLMRAPRSVWARWVEAEGWPVPLGLRPADAAPERNRLLRQHESPEFPEPAQGSGSIPTTGPSTPSGIRTTSAATAEDACRKWLAGLKKRPKNKDTAFADAQAAVANVGSLSRKAFDRAWPASVPLEWLKAGRRSKVRP